MVGGWLSIRTKIFGGFLIVLSVIGVLGLSSFLGLEEIDRGTVGVEVSSRVARAAQAFDAALTQAGARVRQAALTQNELDLAAAEQAAQALTPALENLRRTVAADENQGRLATIAERQTGYLQQFATTIELIRLRRDYANDMRSSTPGLQRIVEAMIDRGIPLDHAEARAQAGVAERTLLGAVDYGYRYAASRDPAESEATLLHIERLAGQVAELAPLVAELPLAKRMLDAFLGKLPNMIASIHGLVDTTEKLSATDAAFAAATAELATEVGELRAAYFEGQRRAVIAMSETVGAIRQLNIVLPLIALVISALIASLVGIGISRLILRMAKTMTKLAGGDTSLTIPALERRDEIGRMAAAVQVFKENAIALIASEARYRELLENLVEGVYQTTPDGRLLAVNQAYATMLGYSSAAEIMASVTDISHQLYVDPQERQGFVEALKQRNQVHGYELRLLRRDGRPIVVSCSARIVRENGAMVRIEGTLSDITARREAEDGIRALNAELEDRVGQRTADLEEVLRSLHIAQEELVRSEKLAGLGALVAGIAHEVNTPIGASVTVATTLQQKAARFTAAVEQGGLRRSVLTTFLADLGDATEMILRSLQQASTLIANFKQVAVDQTSERRRSFDCATVTTEIMSTLHPMVKHRTIQIEQDIPPGIMLDSFPGAFGQVITNLVTNALIHGLEDRETGLLRITGALRSEGSDKTGPEKSVVVLTVSDDGHGISPAIQSKIFDPFFTTKLGTGGSGLGLHLVYSIVTRILGGRIAVTSQPGEGTCFTLTLPTVAPAF